MGFIVVSCPERADTPITLQSRCGPAFTSLGRSRELEDADSGDTPAPPNRIAAGHFVTFRWWGVVNTRTLSEISIIFLNGVIQ